MKPLGEMMRVLSGTVLLATHHMSNPVNNRLR